MSSGANVDGSGTTPTQLDLLLTATLASGAAAHDAWAAWYASVGSTLDEVDHAAARLLPQTYANLVGDGDGAGMPAILAGIARHAWVRNQLLLRGAAAELVALRALGVTTMVLKGAAAIATFGGSWTRRRLGDVDVLVAPESLDAAVGSLVSRGWIPEGRVGPATVRTRMVTRRHGWGFVQPEPGAAPLALDLHWHALIESLGDRADARLWAGAVTVDLVGVETLAPAPTDLLFHLCAHAGGDLVPRVQAVVDTVTILRSGHAIDAPRLAMLARAYGVVVPLRRLVDDVARYEPTAPVDALCRALDDVRPRRIERRATTMVGRPRPRRIVSRVSSFASRFGGGATGTLGQARSALRAHVDRPLIARPRAFALYLASGRRAMVGRLVRGSRGPLATTPSPPSEVGLGVALRPGEPEVLERHGGFGWTWDTDPDGAWTDGPEARLVVALAEIPRSGLRLAVFARPFVAANRVRVDVRINERAVARWRFTPADGAHAWHVVDVAAAVARSVGPLELAFVVRWPQVPMLLGLPADRRRLGLFVSEIRFDERPV